MQKELANTPRKFTMEKDSFEFYSLFDDRVRECQKNSLERKHSLTDFLGSSTEIFSDRKLLICKDWLLSFEAFGFEVFDFESLSFQNIEYKAQQDEFKRSSQPQRGNRKKVKSP